MRKIEKTFAEFGNSTIPLGITGENFAMKIYIDCTSVFSEYPNGHAALTISPPTGDPYPGDIITQHGVVFWQVRNRDLMAPGRGTATLSVVDNFGTVLISATATTVINGTIDSGTVPDQITDWIMAASATLDEIKRAMNPINEAGLKAELALKMLMACGGLFSVSVSDETLFIRKVRLDSDDAYDVAVENGYEGTEEEWEDYVENLGGGEWLEQLSDAVETAESALELAGEKAKVKAATLTIATTDWTGEEAPYTCTKACSAVKADDKLFVGIGESANAEARTEIAECAVACTAQAAGTVTFTAYADKPDVAVPVNIIALEG